AARESPEVAPELAAISADKPAQTRFLELARDADLPATRARMLDLAGSLGWLSAQDLHVELTRLIADQLAGDRIGPAEVDLICTLNRGHELDRELAGLKVPALYANRIPHAAVL